MIPLSIPNIGQTEIEYVKKALEEGWVSSAGPYVDAFEEKVAEYVKAKGAVSCQNGTAGIHTALMCLNIDKDDIVLVPTLTFIAAVNPVKYIGATPVFMDCDESLCINSIKLSNYLENDCFYSDGNMVDKRLNKVVKAIVVVHVFGNMADMCKIMDIAEKYNLKVIEDATEAIGTYYIAGRYEGSFAGTIGDIGVYSFNGNKIITTGGGGMIVSNNLDYLKQAKHLTTQAKSDELYYVHDMIGYNYRMTNVQAALGLAQLEKLEEFIKVKNNNYNEYKKKFEIVDKVELLECRDDIRCNKWFYALYVRDNDFNKDKMIKKLISNGIQVRPIWGLIHEQMPYSKDKSVNIEVAYEYYNKVINIPCSTNLSVDDISKVVFAVKDCMKLT